MTLEQLQEQVLRCIDESGSGNNSIMYEQFPIEQMLNDAGRQLLLTAPNHVFTHPAELSATPQPQADGSGTVALPEDFLRLLLFRMEGWSRPVTELSPASGPLYRRQFHPDLRGGTAKPVVIHEGDKLHYFSLPPGTEHRIAASAYVPDVPPYNDAFPERLCPPLVWLTAAEVLQVTGEIQAAQLCSSNALEQLKVL